MAKFKLSDLLNNTLQNPIKTAPTVHIPHLSSVEREDGDQLRLHYSRERSRTSLTRARRPSDPGS
jgi:hypothetical protein